MAWDPRMAAYQIPYQPLFETTKQEIQRSLLALEDKLRKRKQIDLEIAQWTVPFQSAPPLADNYYQTLRQLEEQERAHRSIMQEEIKLKMAEDMAHQQRMEQLKLERDHLEREAIYSSNRYDPPPLNPPLPNQDEELLKKYEDGSKAKEYYRDLQHQLKKRQEAEILDARAQVERQHRERQKLREIIEQQQQHQTERQNRQDKEDKTIHSKSQQGAEFATPYDYFRSANPQRQNVNQEKTRERSHLAKELEKQFDQLEKKHAKSTQKLPSYNQSTFRTSSPVKVLKESTPQASQMSPYAQRMGRHNSMGRMPCNRSRSNISPHRTSVLDGSYLQAKNDQTTERRPSTKQVEISAIKKIQNRLKVSKVIYEDSRFRNGKYEGNHLFNTFDIESRIRREIRDRINAHPFVLKKHPMVVE